MSGRLRRPASFFGHSLIWSKSCRGQTDVGFFHSQQILSLPTSHEPRHQCSLSLIVFNWLQDWRMCGAMGDKEHSTEARALLNAQAQHSCGLGNPSPQNCAARTRKQATPLPTSVTETLEHGILDCRAPCCAEGPAAYVPGARTISLSVAVVDKAPETYRETPGQRVCRLSVGGLCRPSVSLWKLSILSWAIL